MAWVLRRRTTTMTRMMTSWNSLAGDPALARLKELSRRVANLASDADLAPSGFPTLEDPDWLDRVLYRTSSLFTVIVIGQVSSGKSSFINSLIGRKLLIPSDRPTDGVVSVLLPAAMGEPEFAEKVRSDGIIEHFPTLDEAKQFLRQQDTSAEQQLDCREVRFHLHEPWLRHLRIINTPGLGDRLQAFEQVALQYLHEDESDLVVWTFFPDTAGNDAEVGLFADALARRRKAVVGVVTRCLEGKEDDYTYDPNEDPALVGDRGVVQWLQRNLGNYLREIVLYDSHVSRRLVERMRENPDLQSDDTFIAQLRRSGYLRFHDVLTSLLGTEREHIEDARVASVLMRCSGHAKSMANVAKVVEQEFLRRAEAEKDGIAAWQKVEKEVIGPARIRFKDEVRKLSKERARELVAIMGNSAADAIEENFGLVGTLGRSLVSWTGICDSAADALNKCIAESVEAAVSNARFYERLDKAMEQLTKEHLLALQNDLQSAWKHGALGSASSLSIDTGRPAGGAGDVFSDALSGALKGVVSALLKSLAKNLEKRAVSTATREVTGQATKQAGKELAEQVAKKGAGTVAARIASIVTLVLVPFDIAKLVKDFKKGRQNLASTVRARYAADCPTYEACIFDGLWSKADEVLSTVLLDARSSLDKRRRTRAEHLSNAQTAASTGLALTDLATRLMERAGG